MFEGFKEWLRYRRNMRQIKKELEALAIRYNKGTPTYELIDLLMIRMGVHEKFNEGVETFIIYGCLGTTVFIRGKMFTPKEEKE